MRTKTGKMEILINGKPADIKLDTEKNLGDVLQGIELWISPGGNRINGIKLDGLNLENDSLEEAFPKNINNIGKLEINVSSWRQLAQEALSVLYNTILLYMKAEFNERSIIAENWHNSASARFMADDISDIFQMASLTLKGEGITPSELTILIDSRLREITFPQHEVHALLDPVKSTATRMEELPLDMQTGKDKRAAETMQIFAGIGEKLFRILSYYKLEGLSLDTLMIDTLPAQTFINEFNSALKELSAAFENRDSVLAGDIAEYELAPRLLHFYSFLDNLSESDSSIIPESLLSDNKI